MKTILPLLLFLLCTGCSSVLFRPLWGDLPDDGSGPTRIQVESRSLRVLLFPVNLVPDVLGALVVHLPPGQVWPLQYAMLPFTVLYSGIRDAWHGYPFWEPTALRW
jgi:hypothetical protein